MKMGRSFIFLRQELAAARFTFPRQRVICFENPMSSASLTSLDFRRALGQFATGVTVVTVESAPGRVHGMTANSFTSVSLEPPLISVCVAERAHLLPLLKEKRVALADQPLKDEAIMNIKFVRTGQNIPLMDNVLCQIACRLHATHVAGDHTIVVGEVLSAALHPGKPLLFFRGDYTRLS